MYYFEYHILNSSSNLTILISNEDKIITGSNFQENKITTLNETEIKNINYINTKNNNFTIIYYQNNNSDNNNVAINTTTIIIGGNYTVENNPLLNCDIQINSVKCIKNILAASKANDVHIIPKSRLSSIFELLHK